MSHADRRKLTQPAVEAEVVAVKKKRKPKNAPKPQPVVPQSPSIPETTNPPAGIPSASSPPPAVPSFARQASDSPGMQEARTWGKTPETDPDSSSPFAVGDEDEFQNVWEGGGERSGRSDGGA